jgi:ubiquinone/menaquinone biosynthesis C-methylase UbiE/uncharacterized protein YbaR (Trm112 family)
MALSDFFCPLTREPLSISDDGQRLTSPSGHQYPIIDGIPSLLIDGSHQTGSLGNQEYYCARASEYDRGTDVMFQMLLCDETAERTQMMNVLKPSEGERILEIGAGTCRDTINILKGGAFVYAADLSREMVSVGRNRLERANADFSRLRLFVADAVRLPFPDNFFDAAFHFGGLNLFPDIALGLAELARVVKPGGRVVAGDEGTGPWLADTEFANILQNSNPLFRHQAPLDKIPVLARNVTCRWTLNGSFYLVSFEVGDGEPGLDLDVPFPGWRGGSHRSRYYGKLEGVSPELRDKVVKAASAEGISIVSWLEKTLGQALDDSKA